MKKKLLTLMLGIVLLSASCGSNETNADVSPEIEIEQEAEIEQAVETAKEEEVQEDFPVEIKNGTIEELVVSAASLANNIIDENLERNIMVYLPGDYETSGLDYPVLYFLPGFSDSYSDYIKRFAGPLDEAQIRNMIVVTVDGENNFNGSFYSNSPVIGNWEDYISKDLISFIDENYRTKQDAVHRGIAGHSMGGFGAISLGMNTNVFGHVYAMSPGLLAPDSFQETSVSLNLIEQKVEEYKEMSDSEAREVYLKSITNMSWPKDFTFGYASAFAYDPEGKAPYVLLPGKDDAGNYLQDEVWEMYDSGFGKLSDKVSEKKEQLSALNSLVIEYGENDAFSWIPDGCVYFSELLTEQGIEHTLDTYQGGHEDKITTRIKDNVIPHFQNMWNSN